MLFNGGGNRTTGIPLTGSGIIGGNLGGSTFGEQDKPKKKSKAGLILVLSSVVLLAAVGIIGSQTNWFGLIKEKPIVTDTTKNATPQAGTENVGINNNPQQEVKLINPKGLTAKPGKEAILTENGLNKDGSFYRYYNDNWEVKPKTADGTKSNWQPLKDLDKAFIISLFFSINSAEKNLIVEQEKQINLPKNPPIEIVNKGGNNGGGNSKQEGLGCGLLRNLLNDVNKPHASGEGLTIQNDLSKRLKAIDKTLCTSCKNGLTWDKVREAIIKINN
jgi:hypothetical protein